MKYINKIYYGVYLVAWYVTLFMSNYDYCDDYAVADDDYDDDDDNDEAES